MSTKLNFELTTLKTWKPLASDVKKGTCSDSINGYSLTLQSGLRNGTKESICSVWIFSVTLQPSSSNNLTSSSNLYSSSNHFKTNFCVSFFFLRALCFLSGLSFRLFWRKTRKWRRYIPSEKVDDDIARLTSFVEVITPSPAVTFPVQVPDGPFWLPAFQAIKNGRANIEHRS